jgi:glycine oxidase
MRHVHGRTDSDVVVIGGGVIGLATAWRVGVSGRAVTLLDPEPGRGATWAAAGMLAPVGEAHFGEERLSKLLVEAARAWPGFARDLETVSEVEIGYRREGTLLVAVDASDRTALDDLLAYRRALGLEAVTLSVAGCRTAEPLVSPSIRSGADLLEDHQVDNRRLVDALQRAAGRTGVVTTRVRAAGVIHRGRRVVGVTLDDGREVGAETVVVAAGCWSRQLAGWPEHLRPPVRPVKGLTLRLRAGPRSPRLERTVRGLVHGRSCYVVPRIDGTVVVGATVEERGFDLSVQAGPMGDLLDDARRLVPALDDYELCESSTGLRPGSPDNGPIVGDGGLDGLVVATGHYRNGILLAPLTADEVLRLVEADGGPSAPPTPSAPSVVSPFDGFRPDRFLATGDRPRRPAPASSARPAVAGRARTKDR